ncbi:hypothetical protein NNRS527_02044 [Nitrosospira sp. NRS527]|nr:hypothetical protein NNRS527_02044 [Nitrosospira sp. NRS527]
MWGYVITPTAFAVDANHRFPGIQSEGIHVDEYDLRLPATASRCNLR